MSSELVHLIVIIVLLIGFIGMSIVAMLLHGHIAQLRGYIRRLEKFDGRKWHEVDK